MAPRTLVVGSGSAGRRHARNFHSLGARITCFDPRRERLAQVADEVPGVETCETFEGAVAQAADFNGVVVASPPAFHVAQALEFVSRGVPVLLEKPMSPDLASARRLREAVTRSGTPLLLGYTYRWWPPLLEFRDVLSAGVTGRVRHARFVMSAHLADWHPWERYQDFFMASQELGGGALLDESHFLDLMLWFFGMPEAILGRAEHLSSLEITTDDNVDVVAIYPDGLRVTIHLDLFGRPHEKTITVVGETGTLQCLFDPPAVRFSGDSAAKWETTPFSCERNDMFLAEASEFLDVAAGRRRPSCGVDDGMQVLRCVEAVRVSTREGTIVRLDEVR